MCYVLCTMLCYAVLCYVLYMHVCYALCAPNAHTIYYVTMSLCHYILSHYHTILSHYHNILSHYHTILSHYHNILSHYHTMGYPARYRCQTAPRQALLCDTSAGSQARLFHVYLRSLRLGSATCICSRSPTAAHCCALSRTGRWRSASTPALPLNIYIYVYIYVYICIYICIYIYVYICIYVYIYVYMYIYVYGFWGFINRYSIER
jgi:hypothetical protein